MTLNETITAVFTHPSPTTLWQLQADLLQAGLPPEAAVWDVLDHFYDFLNGLIAHTSAQQYSQLASLFDIGALGGVALQNLLGQDVESADLWQRFLMGSLSEGLMVLASRQYVKAAGSELTGVHRTAAWYLYRELWLAAARLQPEQEPADEAGFVRRQLLDRLLAPLYQEDTHDVVKAILIGRLFQFLLLIQLNTSLRQLSQS